MNKLTSAGLEAPYAIDADWIIPGANAAGRWDSQLQSGHAVAPLLAQLVERIPPLTLMSTTRCVIEPTRAIPLRPLRWRSAILRQGKKLQMVRSALVDGDQELASLTALRARVADTPPAPSLHTYPTPKNMPPLNAGRDVPGFEVRVVGNAMNDTGNGTIWSRLRYPIIEGVAATPFAHAISLADIGSGMANALSIDAWNFPSIDVVVMFARQPEGEWLLLDAVTESAGNGLAIVSGVMADQQGPFARAHQTLFIEPKHR